MRTPNRASRLATYMTAAAAAAAGALALTASAGAATFTATDTASLATAVASSNSTPGANTINVASGTYAPASTLAVTSGPLTIQGPVGVATANTIPAKIIGGAVVPTGAPVFKVNAGVVVNFNNVDITNAGTTGSPALDDFGTANLNSSTISANGPALNVESGATGALVNSTISDGNDVGIVDQGNLTLTSSTITRNPNGGVDDTSGTLHLVNSIVAKNGTSKDCTTPAVTSDHSLDSDGTCGVGALSSQNPALAAINLHGGSTPTDLPGAGSPEIDAGNAAACPAVDQRNAARKDSSEATCDIGAVEFYDSLTFTNTNVTVGVVAPATTKSVTYAPLAPAAGSPVTSTCTPASPQTVTVGNPPLSVTCNGTDAFANAATTTFTITAVNETAPTVTPPANQTAASTDGNPVAVTYPPATATDNADGTIPAPCTPASGSLFPVGVTTVNCSATNSSSQTGTASFTVTVTFSGDLATNTGTVKGTVPFQLSITAFTADFGPFTPGLFNSPPSNDPTGNTYAASAAVTVTSSDAATTLSINDTSTAPTSGHLVNGAYSLASPVMDEATSTSPVAASDPTPAAFAPLTPAAHQILHYTGSVANDPVALSFKQFIGKTEGLHRGVYAANVLLQLVGTP